MTIPHGMSSLSDLQNYRNFFQLTGPGGYLCEVADLQIILMTLKPQISLINQKKLIF